MYRFREGSFVKRAFLAAMLLALANLVSAAPDDLEDAYAKLKEAVAKKDADGVKSAGADTYKAAQALVTAAKPSGAEEIKDWEARVDYGKQVTEYTEYALAYVALQGGEPAKVVSLVDALIAQNPKSKYLDEICANAYLAALGKTGGAAKQMDGMAKIVAGRPDNIVALTALIEGRPATAAQNAPRLIAAARKAKPEGIADADWEKTKNAALGNGYYWLGFTSGQKEVWIDCDKNLRAALPLIANDATKTANAYFTLGICQYRFGKMTNDRSKMVAGQQSMEKAAGMKGPYQTQAYQQNLAMKNELAGRR
jgi:hypothetical protein